jgi:hypothetical protein
MLPLVRPEIAYWIICEKSVIEPQPHGWAALLQSLFERAIGVHIGGKPHSSYYPTSFCFDMEDISKPKTR